MTNLLCMGSLFEKQDDLLLFRMPLSDHFESREYSESPQYSLLDETQPCF